MCQSPARGSRACAGRRLICVHSACGSGVPRRFPAVARRRFYWPSPSRRPLNVDPRVWADSKARPRRRRSTGKEADFLALDATPDARFTGSSQRVTGIIGVRPGGDFEATVRHKPVQYGFPKLKRRPTWQTCVLVPTIRPSPGAVWAAEAKRKTGDVSGFSRKPVL